MKQNIWLFLLFFLVVMIGVASGYAVARRGFVRATTLARAVDFERQRCSEGMSSFLRQEWNNKQLLKMERDLAQQASAYCTHHHGSMEGFDNDAVWRELQEKYDNDLSDMPTFHEP